MRIWTDETKKISRVVTELWQHLEVLKICQKYSGTALITGEVHCMTTKTKATTSSVNHSTMSIDHNGLLKCLQLGG